MNYIIINNNNYFKYIGNFDQNFIKYNLGFYIIRLNNM